MSDIAEISTNDPDLKPVIDKVLSSERLSRVDGLVLEETNDVHALARLANYIRFIQYEDNVGYIVNSHVNYTNICSSGCRFCAFHISPGSEGGFSLTPGEAIRRIPDDVDEIHLVGGLNPVLELGYFTELLVGLHLEFPSATLKAFTAVEIFDLAKKEQTTSKEVLKILRKAGLGMMPGGGAEILDPEIRKDLCPNKAGSFDWLRIHQEAHELGIPSNTTMLYGHIESAEHRIDHLLALRNLQDDAPLETGIVAHIPLPYLTGSNELGADTGCPNGTMDIKQMAIARLMLDNIPHIKTYWRALGIRMAQACLHAGADDFDGTISREDVMHEAGSDAPRCLTSDQIEKIITQAGFNPARRDSFHEPVGESAI